ncbi:MAG: DUF4384 domain-containing protein [Planctomycetaceae bacterium]|jgi:hypothetical protein|nr:DUF4384 domain-containing protein [Planctomycetaceae bacterium]
MRKCFLILLLFLAAEIIAAEKIVTENNNADEVTEFDLSGSLIPLTVGGQSTFNLHKTLPESSTPWSGYSWSLKHDGLQFPLNIYDRYDIGKTAAHWEKQHRLIPESYNSAWAASALLEKEPAGNSAEIKAFRKGLLAGLYDSDKIKIIAGKPQDDLKKIQCTPKELWLALQEYFDRYKHSIIICFDGVNGDRNIPIFAYNITGIPESPESKKLSCILTLSGVDTTSSRNDHELKLRKDTIQFVCNINDEGMINDDGQWKKEGNTVIPSYAWIPLSTDDVPIRNMQLDKVKARNLINLTDDELEKYLTQATQGETKNPDSSVLHQLEQTPKQVPAKTEMPKPETPTVKPIYLSIEEMLYLMSNKHSDFFFNASIQGGDGSIRTTGEKFKVFVESEKPGFLYIVAVNNQSDISMIYPVRGENNFVAGNKTVTALPKDDRFFQFSGNFPIGAVRLKVFLTGVPIHISGADDTKILDRQQLSYQSLQAEGIDTDDLFGVMITEDSKEMVPMCWLTRRLRMARQQRRAVANSVKEFPESGEVTPPEIVEEEFDESDTENESEADVENSDENKKRQDTPDPSPSDKEATPPKIAEEELGESDTENESETDPKNPGKNETPSDTPDPLPSDKTETISDKKSEDEPEVTKKTEQENQSKQVDEDPFKIINEKNSDENQKLSDIPEPSQNDETKIVSDEKQDKKLSAAKIEPKPDVDDLSDRTIVGQHDKVPPAPSKSILDDNPFTEIIGQKKESALKRQDVFDSQHHKVATTVPVRKSDNPPTTAPTPKNNYSDMIMRNPRTLFKGFAQDEVLIIFSDKPIQ